MPLSIRTKWEIVFLAKHKQGPHLSPTEIAKEVNVSKCTVKYWIRRFQETGDVEDMPRGGCPRKTTEKEDEMILALHDGDKDATAKEIKSEAKKKKVEVSSSTIRRRLVEAGVKYGSILVKPLLTHQHRQQRLLWAKEHLK